jgi:hypothetical protein
VGENDQILLVTAVRFLNSRDPQANAARKNFGASRLALFRNQQLAQNHVWHPPCSDIHDFACFGETMHDLSNHLRFAIRQLRRNPGFALTAILTLAIGIGATTAIFSIFYGVLLRPLPYFEPNRLVAITPLVSKAGTEERIDNEASYPNFRDWRTRSKSFESMAAYHPETMVLNATGLECGEKPADRRCDLGLLSCSRSGSGQRTRLPAGRGKARESGRHSQP